MKISQVKSFIEGKPDDEIIVGAFLEKWDADYLIEEMNDGITEEDDITAELTDDEWVKVVEHMANDDAMWQALNEAFDYYVRRVLETRKGI